MADTNADGVYVIGKSGGMRGVADNEVEQRRGRALHAPGAALTTAATTSHAFPVAVAEICKRTHS